MTTLKLSFWKKISCYILFLFQLRLLSPKSPFGYHYHPYVYQSVLSPVWWIKFSPAPNDSVFLKSKSLIFKERDDTMQLIWDITSLFQLLQIKLDDNNSQLSLCRFLTFTIYLQRFPTTSFARKLIILIAMPYGSFFVSNNFVSPFTN